MTSAEVLLRISKQRQLRGVHLRIVFGIITKPQREEHDPDHTKEGKDHKSRAPAYHAEHPHHEEGCKGAAPAGRQPGDALRHVMLTLRQPHAEHLRDVWKTAGIARTEEKAAHHQRHLVPRIAGGRGEEAPEHHDAQQHPARPPFVPQPAAGYLKQGIRQRESREHIAHLRVIELQILLDEGPRLRDAHAVDVMNDAEHHGEKDHAMTGAGGTEAGVHERRETGMLSCFAPRRQSSSPLAVPAFIAYPSRPYAHPR